MMLVITNYVYANGSTIFVESGRLVTNNMYPNLELIALETPRNVNPIPKHEVNTAVSQTTAPSKINKNPPERFYVGIGLHKIHNGNFNTNSSIPRKPYYTSSYSTDFVMGYNFTSWFALEGELNSGGIEQYSSYGFTVTDASGNKYNIYGYDSYYLYDLFVNGVFRYKFNSHNAPFLKLGIGYSKYSSEFWYPYDFVNSAGISLQASLGYEYKFNFHHAVTVSYNYYYTRPYNDYSSYLAHEDFTINYKYYVGKIS